MEEYGDAAAARQYAAGIVRFVTRPWTIMEILWRAYSRHREYGIDELLAKQIMLGLDPLYLANEGRFIAFVPEP